MKKYLIFGLLIGLVFSVGVALAGKPDLTPKLVTVVPSGGQAKVVIPANAVEVAPGVFYLGTAIDNGKAVEGYAFIDYKKGFAKPTGCNNDGVCQGWEVPTCADCVGGNGGTDNSSCYGFLAKGARWKVAEPYVVASDVDTLATAIDLETWDNQVLFEIFGGQDLATVVDGADTVSPDQKNEIMFDDISDSGAIAVAIVWGVFIGPPSGRELVEYDVVFDNADYNWYDCTQTSCTLENKGMDFENIATHEFGHAAGMADLYTSQCSEQTMYGYAGYGETKKRDLEAGDVTGIKALYK